MYKIYLFFGDHYCSLEFEYWFVCVCVCVCVFEVFILIIIMNDTMAKAPSYDINKNNKKFCDFFSILL